jgi:hypothetical protein
MPPDSNLRGQAAAKVFRISPERGDKRFYRVLIFPTKALMYHYFDLRHARRRIEYRLGFEPSLAHDFAALTTGYETYRRHRGREVLTNDVGEILFHEGFLGAGVVSHEMTHAALFWLERVGLSAQDLADPSVEERLCLVVGHLCRKFWAKYFTWPAEDAA